MVKYILTSLKGVIDNNAVLVGNFNAPLSAMDRSSRQKISKEMLELNYTLNQMDLTDTYRTLYQPAVEYIFFSSTHGIAPRTDCVLHNLLQNKSQEILKD